jgi:hypothetical protein
MVLFFFVCRFIAPVGEIKDTQTIKSILSQQRRAKRLILRQLGR